MARTKQNKAEDVVKEVTTPVEGVEETVVAEGENLGGQESDGIIVGEPVQPGEPGESAGEEGGEEIVDQKNPEDNDNEDGDVPDGILDAKDAPSAVKGDNIPEHLQVIKEQNLPEVEVKRPIQAEKCWVPTNEFPSAIVAQKLF